MTLVPISMRLLGPFGQALLGPARFGLDMVRAIFRSWHNRREILFLAECDDHILKDVGLSRPDVEGALAASFGQDPSVLLRRASRNETVFAPRCRPSRAEPRLDVVELR